MKPEEKRFAFNNPEGYSKWKQLDIFYDSGVLSEKDELQRRHAGAVFAPISYENSPAVAPPSPAGNEAFITQSEAHASPKH